jgi:hypothetical protein
MSDPGPDLHSRVVAAIARFGRTHAKVLPLRLRLADGLLAHRLDDEAFDVLDALVSDCEADLGPRHDSTLVLTNNRAMRLAERGRPGGPEQLAALVPIATEVWGPLDRRTVLLRSNLAAATGMAGRCGDAIAQLEALLDQQSDLDDDVIDTLRTNLASWRESSGS